MASCDGDVLGSGMEMQHAMAHIIRAEYIRCYLCECTTVQSLCVKLKQGETRGRGMKIDGKLLHIPFTIQFM